VNKKPTIVTVAAEAGVAVSTVSRFLNGHYVSRPVRARLSEVIERLDYSRSWTARNLSLGRRGCIGVVVDSSEDPWFVQLLTGIEEELSTRDTGLMLSSLELRGRYDPKLVLEWIRDRRIDGAIVVKAQRRERSLLNACVEAKMPVVTVAPDERVPHVVVLRCNNIGGGRAIAAHLADLGHTQIAFAGGPSHSIDSRHRLRGLRTGLSERGIALDAKRVFSCGAWDAVSGERFAERFLSRPLDVTAIVLANDALAFGFMRVAQQHGLRMPADLSLAGFDGLPHGELFFPSLTTVAQPIREMGRLACGRLFDAISHPGVGENIEFPMQLIVRESTGPVRLPATGRSDLHIVRPIDAPGA
jgi:LacI family transcriptional regulator